MDIFEFGKLLADETRQKIMKACCCRWCSVSELVDQVGVGQPTVSHHLGLLRQAGLVHARREGRQVFYSLNQDAVAECCGRLILDLAPETPAAEMIDREQA